MTALTIAVVSQVDAVEGAWTVGVRRIAFIVGLDVGSKGEFAMPIEVKILLVKDCSRTVVVRDAILGWEEIQFLG